MHGRVDYKRSTVIRDQETLTSYEIIMEDTQQSSTHLVVETRWNRNDEVTH